MGRCMRAIKEEWGPPEDIFVETEKAAGIMEEAGFQRAGEGGQTLDMYLGRTDIPGALHRLREMAERAPDRDTALTIGGIVRILETTPEGFVEAGNGVLVRLDHY